MHPMPAIPTQAAVQEMLIAVTAHAGTPAALKQLLNLFQLNAGLAIVSSGFSSRVSRTTFPSDHDLRRPFSLSPQILISARSRRLPDLEINAPAAANQTSSPSRGTEMYKLSSGSFQALTEAKSALSPLCRCSPTEYRICICSARVEGRRVDRLMKSSTDVMRDAFSEEALAAPIDSVVAAATP